MAISSVSTGAAQIQHPAIHPDDLISSRWNLRLWFIPVIPTFMF
jgi:hypothetical protein